MSPYAYPSTFTYPTSTSPASSSATSDGSSHSEIKPGRPLYTISHLDVTQLANQPPLTTSAPLITNNNTTRYSPMAVKKNNAQQRIQIAHPYARLVAKKGEVKRRKIWNHALEKSLFTPFELYVLPLVPSYTGANVTRSSSTMGAPHRRGIYTASLESHIDDLHDQLLEYVLLSCAPCTIIKCSQNRLLACAIRGTGTLQGSQLKNRQGSLTSPPSGRSSC